MRRILPVLGLVAGIALAGWGLVPPAGAAYDPADAWQGLPEGEGREEVFYNCVACHSMAIVMQQRLSEGYWRYTLERMVDDMGMPALPDDEYDLVLDYLVAYFGTDVPR